MYHMPAPAVWAKQLIKVSETLCIQVFSFADYSLQNTKLVRFVPC